MRMRADIERNVTTEDDLYGGAAIPDFQAWATLPCFVYSKQDRTEVLITDAKKTASIQDFRALFALNADILEADQIASIKDRKGNEIIKGRFRIDSVQRTHRHLEAALERVI